MKTLLSSDRYIRTPRFKEVHEKLKHLSVAELYEKSQDAQFNQKSLQDSVQSLQTWLQPVLNLNEYPYVYFINGITEGLSSWVAQEKRPIQALCGDYGWIQQLKEISEVNSVADLSLQKVTYISQPFSADGNYSQQWYELLERKIPCVLDAAMVGTTEVRNLPLTESVEKIFFSLSKSFGLGHFRIGFVFCRKSDSAFEALQQAGYHSVLGIAITGILTRDFPIDYFYKKLRARQLEVCQQHDLQASDSFLLATSKNASFDHLKRKNGVNRICLSSIY